jgi:hypothetical protein
MPSLRLHNWGDGTPICKVKNAEQHIIHQQYQNRLAPFIKSDYLVVRNNLKVYLHYQSLRAWRHSERIQTKWICKIRTEKRINRPLRPNCLSTCKVDNKAHGAMVGDQLHKKRPASSKLASSWGSGNLTSWWAEHSYRMGSPIVYICQGRYDESGTWARYL